MRRSEWSSIFLEAEEAESGKIVSRGRRMRRCTRTYALAPHFLFANCSPRAYEGFSDRETVVDEPGVTLSMRSWRTSVKDTALRVAYTEREHPWLRPRYPNEAWNTTQC
jgi:hypothetical protein